MQRIKKGDNVLVIAGDDKGKQGRVLRMVAEKGAIVEGLNLCFKHVKPNPNANQQGGIVKRELPIHLSNLVVSGVVDKGKNVKKYGKVGYKFLEDGRKVRYFRSNDELIDVG